MNNLPTTSSQAFPGMVPYKRPATDKSGIQMYQPGATTYQQLMQLQQPFVPVSCEYPIFYYAPPPPLNFSSSANETTTTLSEFRNSSSANLPYSTSESYYVLNKPTTTTETNTNNKENKNTNNTPLLFGDSSFKRDDANASPAHFVGTSASARPLRVANDNNEKKDFTSIVTVDPHHQYSNYYNSRAFASLLLLPPPPPPPTLTAHEIPVSVSLPVNIINRNTEQLHSPRHRFHPYHNNTSTAALLPPPPPPQSTTTATFPLKQ